MTTLFQSLFRRPADVDESRMGVDEWVEAFKYASNNFLLTGNGSNGSTEAIEGSFRGLVNGAYKGNGIVFAAMVARMSLFSEARFQWQRMTDGRPGDLFGTRDLAVLESPWPNGTTGELLSRMIQDTDIAGNFYAIRDGARIRRLRPDWVDIILTGDPVKDARVDVAGYVYTAGGRGSGGQQLVLEPSQVAHWSPNPDPDAMYRGMSWLTPILREVQSDGLATRHKMKFFENGATLQAVVSLKETVSEASFKKFATMFAETHEGVDKAYKSLVVGGGADVTLVGADMKQLDFRATQGAGETRIAAASGMHPVILGLSEGLSGSSLNQGNFSAARRLTADKTMRPLWRSACSAIASILPPQAGARLWFDDRDIAFLREDRKDLSAIQQSEAVTIKMLVENGWTPDSVKAAVLAQDWAALKHSGLTSVQLQAPGADGAASIGDQVGNATGA